MLKQIGEKYHKNVSLIFYLVCFVNVLNYLDRGIIPGSTNEFLSFIDNSLETNTPDIYLGLLQSCFVVGFIIGAVIFGHMIHYCGRFYLTTLGLTVWMFAVVLSGVSKYTSSYIFLAFARTLSGFGEAGLQCSVPPWIEHNAPSNAKGMWLSAFFTAIPFGTAIGYAYSSLVSSTLGWEWAFFIEALMMFPFAVFLFSIAPYYPCGDLREDDTVKREGNQTETYIPPDDLEEVQLFNNENSNADSTEKVAENKSLLVTNEQHAPTLYEELMIIVSNPIFLCLICGYAAQTGALIGLSTFGSAFVMGLGYFDSESSASAVFGLLVSFAGILGTPFGGYLIDRINRNIPIKVLEVEKTEIEDKEIELKTKNILMLKNIAIILTITCGLGTFCMSIIYCIYDEGAYLFMLTIGAALVFASNPGINLAIMLSVPVENRSFAIALDAGFIHIFGDVPSPIIVGFIKDSLAPSCVGSDDDGGGESVATSDACRSEGQQLRLTMLLTSLWLLWTVIFFGLVLIISYLKSQPQMELFGLTPSRRYSKVILLDLANEPDSTSLLFIYSEDKSKREITSNNAK